MIWLNLFFIFNFTVNLPADTNNSVTKGSSQPAQKSSPKKLVPNSYPQPDNLQPEFRKFFSDHVDQIISAKNQLSRWQLIEKSKALVTEFENHHEKNIGTKTRIDISYFLVMYWPILPSKEDFDLTECPNYKQKIYSDSNTTPPDELDEIGRQTMRIIDALCNK